MTNNPNTKYTDLTQSQRLKEIGFDAEADGLWVCDKELTLPDKTHPFLFTTEGLLRGQEIEAKSYRLDTLLGHVKYPAHELQTALCRLDIVAAIAAAVDLLVLLKEVEDNA